MATIVVIGAGVGGLAAAARLAAQGHAVTLVERSTVVGGKLGRLVVGDYRFDTGPSLLTLPQVFSDLFAATGSTLDSAVELLPLDPVVRHVFPDGSVLDSCADPHEFADRIAAAFGGAAAAGWRRFWRRAGRIWDASWRDVLRSPLDSPRDLLRLGRHLGDLAAIAPGRTLRGLGRAYLPDPRLRQLLDRYATYAGSDPRRAPAALASIPYAELTFGGWYVRGGLATLADALVARCEALGVRVVLGTAVTRIETAGGRVSGVRLAGGDRLPADVVVANADAAAVYRDLLPDRRRAAAVATRSLGGFVILLGVRGRGRGSGSAEAGWPATSQDLAHHTVFFPADYDAEFDAVLPRRGLTRRGPAQRGRARPVDDPTVFVTVADDPAVHPPGHEAWFILVNAAPHGSGPSSVDWRRAGLAEAYADSILATLARRGVDVRDRVVFREVRTPAELQADTGTPGGAIYGTPRHGPAGLLRPANRGPVPGLFLVGGSTHPGGGLPMVALSAEIVATQIGPA